LFLLSLFFDGEIDSSAIHADKAIPLYSGGLDVHFFYGEGCPHCTKVEPFLDEMEEKYPLHIHRYDIYTNRSSISLFDEICNAYGTKRKGVPTVFVSDAYLVGDSTIIADFEDIVKKTLDNPTANTIKIEQVETSRQEKTSVCNVPSILTITVAGLVDSISPCSLAILVFLIGARVLVNRKKRILRVGLAFCLSVFIAYFLFGLGLLTIVQLGGFSNIFSLLVGLVAVVVGMFSLKDVFWYRKGGFSMEVPSRLKPVLMQMLKGVASPIGAFLMGFAVVCFELPCTGGPYLFILGQLADSATRLQTVPLLLYYNSLFISPLILVSLLLYSNVFSVSRVREWNDRNKRLLHLIGGFTLIALGFLAIPASQTFHYIRLLFFCSKAIGPFVLLTTSIHLIISSKPSAKTQLYSATFLIFLLGTTSFLVTSFGTAIADPGNVPQGKASGWYKKHEVPPENQEIFTPSSTSIDSCQVLSTGTYILTADILNHAGNCFFIPANTHSVTLDCNGHTISGDGEGTYYGIGIGETYFEDKNEYINITNCNIENFYAGIYGFQETFNSYVENNHISNNDIGIYFHMGSGILIAHNFIVDNSEIGIMLSEIRYCQMYDNFFSNTNDALEIAVDPKYPNGWDYLSIDCSIGPNIIGGPCIGGNYWKKPDGTGFSETCTDSDGDGICDNPYVIPGVTSDDDSYPLTDYIFPEVTITSPEHDRTYKTDSVPLKYVVNKHAEECYYYLNVVRYELPNCENTTLNNLADATYTVKVYAKDIVGNEGMDQHKFYVDTSDGNPFGGGRGFRDMPMFDIAP